MNSRLTSILITTTLVSSLILLSSCSKKTIAPPEGTELKSASSTGTNLDYPNASSYSESGIAGEESMDSTGGPGSGNLSINNGADQQSFEYRRTYGRSSTVFGPVYYEFDQAGISSEMAPILSSNASYMKDNPNTAIVIEGNCDERGTNEYNLALGERRAINAKEYMINLGVDPMRIRTVSYGEERPLFTGQDDLDWSLNRRADFIAE